MSETPKQKRETVTEQIEVAGSQLVEKVQEIVAEGNVRRIILRAPDDKVMLEMTLTTAAFAGALTLAAPWLAALGAIAALVTKMRIEIVRDAPPTLDAPDPNTPPRPTSTGKQKVKIEVED
jgi:hypothetical protein